MPRNWQSRDKKLKKRKGAMRVSGRSTITLQQALEERDRRKRKREDPRSNMPRHKDARHTRREERRKRGKENPNSFDFWT